MAGREKRALGDVFGLTDFGVNLSRIEPGGVSSLRHAHAEQDEFVYVLEGRPTLVTNSGETPLEPGMCAGFASGTGNAHHLVNRSDEVVAYLEVGTRGTRDSVVYPDDDLELAVGPDKRLGFRRKNGTPY